MDLSTLTIEQLKAIAYDLIMQGQQLQNNLNAVNQAIAVKQSATPAPTTAPTQETVPA